MRRPPRLRTILALLTLCIGCSDSQERGSHKFLLETRDNITFASSTGTPLYQQDLFEYEEVLRLSEFQSTQETYFVRPSRRIAVDDQHNFYIADNGVCLLYQFNLSGQLIKTFGGEGEGPGEFRSIEIVSIRDDQIAAFDFNLQRTTVFSTAGDLLGTYRSPNHLGRLESIEPIEDGIFGSRFRVVTTNDEFQYNSNSYVIYEMPQQIYADVLVGPIVTMYRFPGGAASIPLSGRPIVMYSPFHGLLATTGEESTVQIFGLDGTHIKTLQVELPKRMITPEIRSRYLSASKRAIEAGPAAPSTGFTQTWLENIPFPTQAAYWSDMQVDASGFIWLRYPEEEPDPLSTNGSVHQVLSPQGEYLGNTQWPRPGGFVSNGYLLTWDSNTEAELGYTAVVYRIHSAIEAVEYP